MPKAVRIVASRPMSATRDQLWSVLADLHRLPEWLAFAGEVADVSGDADRAPGGTYTVRPKARYEPQTRWRVTEVEPGRRQVHASEMPMFAGVTSTIELADAPAGVEVRVDWQGEPKGLPARLMGGFFEKRIRRNWEDSLDALDRVAAG